MKKFMQIGLVLCLLWAVSTTVAMADVITLKSGKTVEGTILFQNDEVVVIRDASGTKYQYPTSEIVRDEPPTETLNESTDTAADDTPEAKKSLLTNLKEKTQEIHTGKKVSMGISLFGGGMFMPGSVTEHPAVYTGGHAGADVMVGTSNLFQRRIFLGGATGYHAFIQSGNVISFIPIMLRAEVPLMLTKHAPMLGMGVGYGIGLQKVKGGVCADLEFGWRYSYSRKGGLFLGVFADFQGAEIPLTETVAGNDYTATAYRNLCGYGAKLALFF